MTHHDDMLTEGSEPDEPEGDELWVENHARCPVCMADLCLAGLPDNIGRENCPCDGEGAEPVICCDGQEVCSDACLSTYEAGA